MDDEVTIEAQQMEQPELQPHRFVWRYQYNEEKSLKEGRPIYEPCIFVEVVSSEGEVRDIKYVKANELHKQKFRKAWNIFKANIAPEIDMGLYDPLTVQEFKEMFPDQFEKYKARVTKQEGGTLLCQWNQCPAKTALELKYLGVFTVEDLLDTDEELVPESLKIAAQEYIESSKNAGRINFLAESLIKAKKIIEDQRATIDSLRKNKGV